MSTSTSTSIKRLRIALFLVIAGLFFQLVMAFYWTPLTFILFTGAGVGAVGLGALLYLVTWWKSGKVEKGGGGEL